MSNTTPLFNFPLLMPCSFQVTPSELESKLIHNPLVREAAVIGVWNADEATEVPRAFVVLRDDAQKQDRAAVVRSISGFVAEQVSNYKRLRGGVVVVDALPKNPTGKILKKALKEVEVAGSGSENRVVAKL